MAPPPKPTTASLRVIPMRPNTLQQKSSVRVVLASSPSGTSTACASRPAPRSSSQTASAGCAQRPRMNDRDPRRPGQQVDELTQQAGPDDDVVGGRAGCADGHAHGVRNVGSRPGPCRRRGRAPALTRRPASRASTSSATFPGSFPSVSTAARGDLGVQRRAGTQQRGQLGPGGAQQQRPVPGHADPLVRLPRRHGQVDDGAAGRGHRSQQLPGLRVKHRPAAERQDAGPFGQRAGRQLALQRAEGGLAVVDEDVRHRLAGERHHVVVGVPEAHPQPPRHQPAHLLLPAPGAPTSTTRGWARPARSPDRQRLQVSLDVAAGLLDASRRRTSPAPRPRARARSSPRRRRRPREPRTRRSAGRWRSPARRWRRRRSRAPGSTSRSASSPPGRAAPRPWTSRLRRRRPARCGGAPRRRPARSRRGPASHGGGRASNPSPNSTPLIAWMDSSAAASRESRRRSPCT